MVVKLMKIMMYSLHFGGMTLNEKARNYAGPMDQDKKLPITDIELKPDTFKFNGEAAEPEVVVKSFDTVVPAESYDVIYIDNDAVGSAEVCVE